MSGIRDFMERQEKDSAERAFRMAMENARNVMRAVCITIEEGNTDEALRLIRSALGDETQDPAASRYAVVIGSQSAHCCFDATVVDTSKPLGRNGEVFGDQNGQPRYEEVCECFDEADARLVCDALNSFAHI